MRSHYSFQKIVFGIGSALVLAACGGHAVTPQSPRNGAAQSSATEEFSANKWTAIHRSEGRVSVASRLYISNNGSGTIDAFALPLTPSSTSVAQLVTNKRPSGMTFDTMHRLFVANNPVVQVFTQPITGGASPAFSKQFQSGFVGDVASNTAGDVAVATSTFSMCCGHFCWPTHWPPPPCHPRPPIVLRQGRIEIFPAGMTVSTPASSSIVSGSVGFFKIAFDPSGGLWVVTSDGVHKYVKPFNGATPALILSLQANDIRFDSAGNMYVSSSNSVDVYHPPFSQSMTRALSINAPTPGYLAFDASGNLYVSSAGKSILVFTPPFNSTSSAVVTLPVAATGLAIGP